MWRSSATRHVRLRVWNIHILCACLTSALKIIPLFLSWSTPQMAHCDNATLKDRFYRLQPLFPMLRRSLVHCSLRTIKSLFTVISSQRICYLDATTRYCLAILASCRLPKVPFLKVQRRWLALSHIWRLSNSTVNLALQVISILSALPCMNG